jgi:hypothetical protein
VLLIEYEQESQEGAQLHLGGDREGFSDKVTLTLGLYGPGGACWADRQESIPGEVSRGQGWGMEGHTGSQAGLPPAELLSYGVRSPLGGHQLAISCYLWHSIC